MAVPNRPEEPDRASLVRAAPVVAWLALAAWWRATEWTVEASLQIGLRVARAAAAGESPAELIRESEAELRSYMRRLLGIGEVEPEETPWADEAGDEPPESHPNGSASAERLRELGADLLRRSAEVEPDDDGHPAYVRILENLAPDEARILRLLALEGPQPSVDVRTSGPLGVLKSDLVAPGLTMIGAQAGCRHPERIHPYLNNLYRLGLIWFSREPLDDIAAYQVLEAQPEVAEAMRKAGRAKTVRRSIHLTPFGRDFCGTCLPLDTAEIDALPGAGT
jgi:hypothetical protein